jgi:hypothetical protein
MPPPIRSARSRSFFRRSRLTGRSNLRRSTGGTDFFTSAIEALVMPMEHNWIRRVVYQLSLSLEAVEMSGKDGPAAGTLS